VLSPVPLITPMTLPLTRRPISRSSTIAG
jgi:hypothetical protein